jgi:biopolymer transport protein ExbD
MMKARRSSFLPQPVPEWQPALLGLLSLGLIFLLGVNRPSSSEIVFPEIKPDAILELQVLSNQQFSCGGQPLNRVMLKNHIFQQLQEHPNLGVLIEVPAELPSSHLMSVMTLLNELEVKHTHVMTTPLK